MLVPGDAVRISKQCGEHVCQSDVKVIFVPAGEFRHHYNGEVLDWSLKITGADNENSFRIQHFFWFDSGYTLLSVHVAMWNNFNTFFHAL